MMRNCFFSAGFSKLVKLRSEELILSESKNLNFFVHHLKKDYDTSGKVLDFFLTPICLSGPQNLNDLVHVIKMFQSFDRFGGAYVQTRIERQKTIELKSERIDWIPGYRTAFYLRHSWSKDSWIRSMRRDSRSRFNKALKDFTSKNISIERYSFSEGIEFQVAEELANLYLLTADQKNFRKSYRFEALDFWEVLNDNSWCLHIVRQKSNIIGFSIIGDTGIELDYTFSVSMPSKIDVSRLLIYFGFCLAKSEQKDLCLGGGIIENDNLSSFKLRMGSEPVKLVNLKLICKNLLHDIGRNNFQAYQNKRWPDV